MIERKLAVDLRRRRGLRLARDRLRERDVRIDRRGGDRVDRRAPAELSREFCSRQGSRQTRKAELPRRARTRSPERSTGTSGLETDAPSPSVASSGMTLSDFTVAAPNSSASSAFASGLTRPRHAKFAPAIDAAIARVEAALPSPVRRSLDPRASARRRRPPSNRFAATTPTPPAHRARKSRRRRPPPRPSAPP